jgi:hypothetical protein
MISLPAYPGAGVSFLFLISAGCTPDGSAPLASDAGVVLSIEVKPPSATVTSGPDGAGSVDFEALATFDDGTTEAIELVSWELSNQSAGEIDNDGTFTSSVENGALTGVTATHNGVSGSAVLTVVYQETIEEDDVGESSAFDGEPVGTVEWLYPEDNVTVPRNVPSLAFMWEEVPGATGYRLSFTTATTAVSVLTNETSWTADGEQWVAIAATNAGGEVSVELRAIAGASVYAAETRTLKVNRLDAQGSIYYWSTTDLGIVKVPIGADEPELFYTRETGSPACVACHVIRGERMGVTYGDNTGIFTTGITDISAGAPSELTPRTRQGYYNTMNPDGTRMITTSGNGILNLWDTDTGEWLKEIDTGGVKLTMPDWSQDGTYLAAIQAENFSCDNCFNNGIVVMAPIDDDGTLGTITQLWDPLAGWGRDEFEMPSTFYPSVSPDGEWIAFNYGDGGSYDNETAQLWVISVNGGDPIRLQNADLADALGNSWPHWGPLPDDDVYWLTFSSKRPYGDHVTDGRPQIWVASFDPTLADAGQDPSAPAFWLSNQDDATSNHTTFWGP